MNETDDCVSAPVSLQTANSVAVVITTLMIPHVGHKTDKCFSPLYFFLPPLCCLVHLCPSPSNSLISHPFSSCSLCRCQQVCVSMCTCEFLCALNVCDGTACLWRKWLVIRASWWVSPSSGAPFIAVHKGPFTLCFSNLWTPRAPGTFPHSHMLTEVNCHALKTSYTDARKGSEMHTHTHTHTGIYTGILNRIPEIGFFSHLTHYKPGLEPFLFLTSMSL